MSNTIRSFVSLVSCISCSISHSELNGWLHHYIDIGINPTISKVYLHDNTCKETHIQLLHRYDIPYAFVSTFTSSYKRKLINQHIKTLDIMSYLIYADSDEYFIISKDDWNNAINGYALFANLIPLIRPKRIMSCNTINYLHKFIYACNVNTMNMKKIILTPIYYNGAYITYNSSHNIFTQIPRRKAQRNSHHLRFTCSTPYITQSKINSYAIAENTYTNHKALERYTYEMTWFTYVGNVWTLSDKFLKAVTCYKHNLYVYQNS